jgi:hypothetical protein
MSKRKIELAMGTEEDDGRTRCNSKGQNVLTDVKMAGLIFVSKINHRNRCFIPSTKNYFAGVQVKKVLVDSGCSSILLPIEENSVDSLFQRFSSDNFIASIGGSTRVGGECLVLLFSHFGPTGSFEVKLCQDIVGHAEALAVKNLRFSLCSEDSAAILECVDLRNRFGTAEIIKLQSYLDRTIARRSHALLGQSVLKELSCIKSSTVEFHVRAELYTPITWKDVEIDTKRLLAQLVLPDSFEEWEDDDNLCHDELENCDWEENN